MSSIIGEAFLKQNLRYLAPETAASGILTEQSTVYGLGAMLYEMITGGRVDNLEDSEQAVDLLESVHRHVTYHPINPIKISTNSTSIPGQLIDIVNKCLAKNAEKRYATVTSLGDDLRRLTNLRQYPRSTFLVGNADRLGRFSPPNSPLHRQEALAALDGLDTISNQINVWGPSGAGKSHLVEHWADTPSIRNKFAFIGRAKLDQHTSRPFTSFSQIFEALVDRVITDPQVQPAIWVENLRETLGSQFPLFAATLSQEHRRVLELDLHGDLTKLNVRLSHHESQFVADL
jgi:serine/threonine protein kinase